jgi:hypothetical protein
MGSFDANTLKALKEMLPTIDETAGLKAYMKKFQSSNDEASGYADLSECEKYMYTVSTRRNRSESLLPNNPTY